MSWIGWTAIGILAANAAFFIPLIARHVWEEIYEKRGAGKGNH